MAISKSAYWRIRISASDTNGGGFDPLISGAGTDYTEQDSAQLTVTDLAASGAVTTLTSATGGFTSAMIGNAISISGGTGFTTNTRYFITAVTDTNTIVIDRAASAGAASGATCRVGGAFSTVYLCSTYYAVEGNTVFVRGQGSNEPVDIDYATNTQVNSGTSYLAYVGYNGRPKVGHKGELWWQQNFCTWENFYFIQTVGTTTTSGPLACDTYGGNCVAYNCVFDSGGFDATSARNVSCFQCTFQNTGAQTAGTKSVITQTTAASGYGVVIANCLIKDARAAGLELYQYRNTAYGNIIQNCLGDGIYTPDYSPGTGVFGAIYYNTIYGCGGHGINLQNSNHLCFGNNINNITNSGKYGIYVRDGAYRATTETSLRLARNNFYGCTNNSNITESTSNLAVDPTYVNAPSDLTPTNTALRILGGVGAL